MGFIEIRSRRNRDNLVYTNMLYDSADKDDELSGFLPGDNFILSLSINEGLAQTVLEKKLPGVEIRKRILSSETDQTPFEVLIECKIVNRSHLVVRDWMTHDLGMRSIGTTVVVESITDEGESLFIELQNQFDAGVQKTTYDRNVVNSKLNEDSEEPNVPF